MQTSTAVRNAQADAVETAIGVSAVLKIRTGLPPADTSAADSGTALATLALPSDWMAAAAGGVKAKLGTWQDASADASGYAGHYRIYASDGVTCHLQGPVSQAWFASTAYVVGQHVNNGGNAYRCTTAGTSAGAGGPSGTGASISDGGCVWAYIGPAEMVMTNTNIAPGQDVTVTAFSWTQGGA
jgi:hypothetical protein